MENIENTLLNLVDEDYKKFNQKLCPDTQRKILGIRIPQLRKLAQKISKEDNWKLYIQDTKDIYFEEIILQGFIIAYRKMPLEEKLEYIRVFVPKMDSWEMTDTFVPTLKIKEKDLETYWKFILPYTKSKKEFEVRFAIISMLDYYTCENYVDKVIHQLDQIQHEGYYVKMAIAWTLAEIGIKFYDKLLEYLKKNHHLDTFTYNKTLQKMIESYRITVEQKEILKKMKIKS